jgi:hypothetical protein
VSPLRESKKKSLLAVPTKCKEERDFVAQALLPVLPLKRSHNAGMMGKNGNKE